MGIPQIWEAKVTLPTDEEIRQAYDGITADGPAADWTLRLGVLVLRNPMLCEFLDRVSTHTGADRATMMACMVAGLNYGLRIGEARVNAVLEKR